MADKALKVLCFATYPHRGPSVRHRIYSYQALLAERNIELQVFSLMTEQLYRNRRRFGLSGAIYKIMTLVGRSLVLLAMAIRSRTYDVVIVHREAFPLGPPWFEALIARCNPRLVYDLDDAIWNPPSFDVNQRQLFWDKDRVAKIMRMSRAVVAGNRYIADYAADYSDDVHVIPTVYQGQSDMLTALEQRLDEPVKVLWIGGLGNAEYLHELAPVLSELATRLPIKFILVGGEDINEVPLSDDICQRYLWEQSIEEQVLRDCHIGLMPLIDRDFELGKCAFKIIQYFSACMPVVASPVGMNCQVVQEGVNGFLASELEQWRDAITQLATNSVLRGQMALSAYRDYQDYYTPEAQVKKWESIIHQQVGK